MKTNSDKTNIKKKFLVFFIIITLLAIFLINPISVKTFSSKDHELSFGVNYVLTFFTIILFGLLSFYFLNLVLIKKGKVKLPNITINISIVFFSFIILIVFIELLFRAFFSSLVPVQLYSYNEHFGMTWHKPNLDVILKTSEYNVRFRTNSIGLRDNRELSKKSMNEISIVVLGDSFIQAAQVNLEKTMCFILENRLNSLKTNKKYRVIGLGTSGCSPAYQRLFLEKNLNKFDPDLLLLFPYIGNDIIASSAFQSSNQSKISKAFSSFITNIQRFSKFFTFIVRKVKMKQYPLGRPCQPFDGETDDRSANIFLKIYNKKIKEAYIRFWDELLKIKNLCRKHGIKFMVFIVPTKEQVDPAKFEEVINFFEIDKNLIDIRKPQRIVVEFLKNNQVIYFDLLEPLFAASKLKKTYFDLDSHWNEYGNKIVADIVFNYLKKEVIRISLYKEVLKMEKKEGELR